MASQTGDYSKHRRLPSVRGWILFNPGFLIIIASMGCLNYAMDHTFRGMVYLHSGLSFLYIFQYHLILPVMNLALLAALFYLTRSLRRRRKNSENSERSTIPYCQSSTSTSPYPSCSRSAVSAIKKSLITKTRIFSMRWHKMSKNGALTCLVPVLLVLLSLSAPTLANPKSGPAGNSGVAHVLLVDKTEDWESIWPGAFGKVKYQVEGDRFVGLITIHGLKPETEYVLTINGQGGKPTDDLIADAALADSSHPSLYDGWWDGNGKQEGYYDFESVTSNKGGNLEYKFSVTLGTGTYSWVKFLVKDTSTLVKDTTTLGWETILMEDAALHFTIS